MIFSVDTFPIALDLDPGKSTQYVVIIAEPNNSQLDYFLDCARHGFCWPSHWSLGRKVLTIQ